VKRGCVKADGNEDASSVEDGMLKKRRDSCKGRKKDGN
jgi:hypothetical protein